MDRPIKSANTITLNNALRNIQAELPHAPKDMSSKMFGEGKATYKYASLQAIIDTARPVCHKYGVIITHSIMGDTVIGTIAHVQSDQYNDSHYLLAYKKEDPRLKSAAVTYAMKDTYRMYLGMVADDDTDGY